MPLTKDPKLICPAEEIKPTTIVIGILVTWIVLMLAGYGLYEVFGDKCSRKAGEAPWLPVTDNGDEEVLLSSDSASSAEVSGTDSL